MNGHDDKKDFQLSIKPSAQSIRKCFWIANPEILDLPETPQNTPTLCRYRYTSNLLLAQFSYNRGSC